MTDSITHDLSQAIAKDSPRKYELGNARFIRFYVVDSPFYVRVNDRNGPRLPIVAPFTMEATDVPYTSLFIDNDGTAGSGNAVVLYGDGRDCIRDFLGDGAGADEKLISLLLLAQTGTVKDVISNIALTALTGGAVYAAPGDSGLTLSSNAGVAATLYLGTPAPNVRRIVTQGVGTKRFGSWRVSDRVRIEEPEPTVSTVRGCFSGFSFNGGTADRPYGIGFWFDDSISDNYMAAIVKYNDGVAWHPGLYLYHVDLGIPFIGTELDLDFEIGADASGNLFAIWKADGVEVHRMTQGLGVDFYLGGALLWPGHYLLSGTARTNARVLLGGGFEFAHTLGAR